MERIKVIGISGKVASGKTYIAEYLSKETGIRLVKLDYQVAEIANKPILKQMLERRLKIKIPKAHEDIQLFPLLKNLENGFSRLEFALVRMSLNKKVKNIIKKSKEKIIIIDFLVLPMLKIAKKFDLMYLVESEEETRLEKLGERDGMSVEKSKFAEKFIERYYDFNNGFPFDEIIYNNYKNLPEKIDEVIFRLTSMQNTDII